MKRIIVFVLTICMLLSFTACGKKTTVITSTYFDESTGEYYETLSDVESDKQEGNKKPSKPNASSSNAGSGTSSKKPSNSSKEPNYEYDPEDDLNNGNEGDVSEEFDYSMHYMTETNGNNKIIVYRATEGYNVCDAYKVEVQIDKKWYTVPVYNAGVIRHDGFGPKETYFASVDLNGVMNVRVTPKESFSSCRVRPTSDNITPTKNGNSVTFSVSGACQLSVEFDGEIMENLQLFVNPIEKDIPDINDPNVIFVKPGVHTVENSSFITKDGNTPVVVLKSNQVLYLAGGAVVKAQILIQPNSSSVTVRGRGIIDLYDFNSASGSNSETTSQNGGIYPTGLTANECANINIEGVIFKDPCSYSVMGNKVTIANIDNIKIFSKSDWADGIDMVASQYITIKNCYIRSNDDGIAIYATRWGYKGDARTWDISNCVFMIDCAHAINIGTHGSQDSANRDEICDISISNLDILDVYENSKTYWGAIAFNIGDQNWCHDVTIEDVRMDELSKSMPFMVCVTKNSSFNPISGYRLENISFKNITLSGKNYNKSQIFGYDANNYVSGITFENLRIGGVKVSQRNHAEYFDIGSHTKNITFK